MKALLLPLILILTVFTVYASGDYDSVIYIKDANLALEGYDTIAYFENNKPIKGSNEWKTIYKNAEWYFNSEKNLNLFLSDPEKYAPAYGGYCAWAMNEGNLAPGKPKHWDIIEGRLYLNYSSSTRKKFLDDFNSMIKNADSKWTEIVIKLSETESVK